MNEQIQQLIDSYERKVIGQSENLRLMLAAIFSGGHVLLEGVPGTGKTKMVRTLAELLGGDFKRIQFTPDLLPSDITGSMIYNMKSGLFETLKGPVFTNILLADEINRTPAKTQAALLEAMEEKQLTIQGDTYPLPAPFFVVATQNPVEFEGTYPLPEAQQDRFMFKLAIDFPALEEEVSVIKDTVSGRGDGAAAVPVLSMDIFEKVSGEIQGITVTDDVYEYITQMVRKTRETDTIRHGASTRAAIAMARASKAWAYLGSRDYVTPDDVKKVAVPALRHRVLLAPHMELEGATYDQIIQELVGSVPVPR
ncbi:AAA domain-containing protein [Halobacillus litoralis]|uniref:AAA domain-containing protein n=1 Tax=Halobacillus litoralis TaxID=45668 RepID=A0A845DUJ8_9BACI|nr:MULTISPECIES: MoxR family ATPase [Halobacillus]MYL20499.1 AAA domain-containing protein [Halobacillus litoralis]MYL29591.1 AAA domain-containing protein [Halobacillus halophilus]